MDKLPPELITVTPLSKYLSLFVFIMLPFIGLLLGFNLGVATQPDCSSQSQYTSFRPTNPEPGIVSPPLIPPPSPFNPSEPDQSVISPPLIPPPSPFNPSEPGSACGVINCQGNDVVCGDTSVSQPLCTMEYRLGDFCRQYASCEVIENSCQAVYDSRHGSCISCVEACNKIEDPIESFVCEDECRATIDAMQ